MDKYIEIKLCMVTEHCMNLLAKMGIEENIVSMYETKYFILNLGNINEESRLFERRIDKILEKIRSDPSVISVVYRILNNNEAAMLMDPIP